MSYKLRFDEAALKQWKKLARPIQEAFKKKLAERLENPHIESARLKGDLKGLYKIKLKKAGYRLVYSVDDQIVTVYVLSVGKRDNSKIYNLLKYRTF